MLPRTWQDLLDSLTLEAQKNDKLKLLSDVKCQFEAMKSFINDIVCRDKLLEWIQVTLSGVQWHKSTQKASHLRALGNERFRRCDNQGSLTLYTESVIHAPQEGDELSLALANRSAALFHLEAYKECLRDIELAIASGYPTSLYHKLQSRRDQCLSKLHKSDALLNSQESVEAYDATKNMPASEDPVPTPLHGESKTFTYASAALELRHNVEKGRHVVTNRDIQMGDILFVEKPYAFVVLPGQDRVHCHHCCAYSRAPVPCQECTLGLYCSELCRQKAWEQYHQWECRGGLELLYSIGIAHLGLRVVLTTGEPHKLRHYLTTLPDNINHKNYGNKEDNYVTVYHLMPHLEDMESEDLFQYTMTACMLALYLRHHTHYFDSSQQDDEIYTVAGLLLRHIAQLVCNGHAITKLDTSSVPNQEVMTETQVRTATAIYPSASMMNHSCDPNIINSFHNEYLIVRACKDIPRGGEVFNCYGPHFRHMGVQERKVALKAQYFFNCSCEPCSLPTQQDFQERFSALRCSKCSGPLLQFGDSAHTMTCGDCGHSQGFSTLAEAAFKAHTLFHDGCEALDAGRMKEAVAKLEECQKLRQQCMYRSHRGLRTCVDTLAKCFAMSGEYNRSVDCLLMCLPAVEEQFGQHSIEMAHELQKLTDVMVCDLQQQLPGSVGFLEKHKKAIDCVQRAKQILELHCGKWDAGLRDILCKEQQLKQM